jgi:hypothetical protein
MAPVMIQCLLLVSKCSLKRHAAPKTHTHTHTLLKVSWGGGKLQIPAQALCLNRCPAVSRLATPGLALLVTKSAAVTKSTQVARPSQITRLARHILLRAQRAGASFVFQNGRNCSTCSRQLLMRMSAYPQAGNS